MKLEVTVPGVGESVQEGMVQTWHKKTGDLVQTDDVLLDLETDKATVEIVAKGSGVLTTLVTPGSVVKVGDVLGTIDTDAKGAAAAPAQPAAQAAAPASTAKAAPSSAPQEHGPAVRRMTTEHGIDPQQIPGTGRDGRVTKGDVVQHLAQAPKPAEAKAAAPAAKPAEAAPAGDFTRRTQREDTRKPMTMLRRRIAERLVSAQQTAALLTTFNEIDMTNVMAMRERYKDKFEKTHGVKLGFMGFFLKASATALKAFPAVNAFIEGNDVIYHNYCDIGVAVSTEKGLMVPVIRDVDQMELVDIELAIAGYAKKARDNKISLEDLSGGTFTVSNGGVFGSLLSTPIVNPPQTAILGMHKTQQRPVVLEDGSIVARPMMYIAMSYDHRLIDGKEAVSFLVKVKECVEDPSRMLLGV